MFRTAPLSIIRSFSLYTQQWHMSHSFCRQLASRIRIHLVEFYSKNKFEKLVHLVGFIIRLPDKNDKSGQYYIRIEVFTEKNDYIFQ